MIRRRAFWPGILLGWCFSAGLYSVAEAVPLALDHAWLKFATALLIVALATAAVSGWWLVATRSALSPATGHDSA